jgi:hypothetical protein
MNNSGKRKYIKKNMKGGEFVFILYRIILDDNGNGWNQDKRKPFIMEGEQLLQFIDGERDTFFNTYKHVRFSKSVSKCYLSDQDGEQLFYQLIYDDRDKNVYQYLVNKTIQKKIVKQRSLDLFDVDLKNLLELNNRIKNKNINNNNISDNPDYRQWAQKLYEAIKDNKYTIDQVLRFFYNNGNINSDLKVSGNLLKYWNTFYKMYKKEFF